VDSAELSRLDVVPVGDAALLVSFGERIDLEINRRVHALAQRLSQEPLDGFIESVPAYCSLLVHYDPLVVDYPAVLAWVVGNVEPLKPLITDPTDHFPTFQTAFQPRRVEIPTVYGGEDGPDLEFVAQYHHLTPEEVIRIHSGVDYPVYMLGFTPGFAYLGGLDARIVTPRLDQPRTRIPAGSVGIAGMQTGVYPLDTPGGWRIIGRTSLRLFDPLADPPALLAPGDIVRFIPISKGDSYHVAGHR
jgi:inhibitor of KinA